MDSTFKKLILFLYSLVFFIIPLILCPNTSELFEFNKMVATYALTLLIVSAWTIRSVINKKLIFRRSALDFPLLLFLLTQILATKFSIDTRTSFLGYYSRYHGGLLSSISYVFLYWGLVSNIKSSQVIKLVAGLLTSAVLVSIYAVLEHFGIDEHIWIQDVRNRVFSTLGQPNWLAAWIVSIMPIAWWVYLKSSQINFRGIKISIKLLGLIITALFSATLLFTKSRSGLLGFVFASIIFWPSTLFLYKNTSNKIKHRVYKGFLTINVLFAVIVLFVGTPWTPKLKDVFEKNPVKVANETNDEVVIPALEKGGTESGEIRKIVWRGAYEIFRNNPIFGTGPETFAFSYYTHRPVEHNLVSEWDFLYNKAHNEYLNFLATTGIVGFSSYALFVVIALTSLSSNAFLKPKKSISHERIESHVFNLALLSGFTSVLITNFFGFSVVPVALVFFLYPAISNTYQKTSDNDELQETNWSTGNILLITPVIIITLFLMSAIIRYWSADYMYAAGQKDNDKGKYSAAQSLLENAVSFSPNEALYWIELADINANIAFELMGQDQPTLSYTYINKAITQSNKAIELSPKNVALYRKQASILIKLSGYDPAYLNEAKVVLEKAVKLAPTDAKLFYNLGLAQIRTDEPEKAIETLAKTVEMKTDYRNARLALALLLANDEQEDKAKEQLKYILTYINPDDQLVKEELEKLGTISR